MYFRPLPLLSAVFVPLFLMLIGLGVWQLERLQWKLGLIAEMNDHLGAPPLSLDDILKRAPQDAQYRRVALDGHFENDHEAYVFAATDNGLSAYHVVTPFVLDDGRTLLVDRGIVPPALRDPETRRAGLLTGEQRIVGVWRKTDPPGVFTPAPDLKNRVWYSRNVTDIARALHIRLAAPVIVEADATAVPGGWPKGGQTVVNLPNDHLQYALTWFLMAGALLVIYLAYHRARGRLGIRRQG
ncbi:MAG TPA: SURF1 family protein [Rhizomicrobium sp.]|nr:SURF1 family protein [Rhizomicrobium sp.]